MTLRTVIALVELVRAVLKHLIEGEPGDSRPPRREFSDGK
jgi:hypothetical protein